MSTPISLEEALLVLGAVFFVAGVIFVWGLSRANNRSCLTTILQLIALVLFHGLLGTLWRLLGGNRR